jgi:hypothetical protein
MWHAREKREKHTWFWWKSPKKRDHSQNQGVDGRIGIRMDLWDIGWGCVEWIQLAQDRDRWLALVNTVLNLRVLVPRS